MKRSQDVRQVLIGWYLMCLANCLQGMNCEKNAVVCEGYNEKTIWKSGRERAEEGMFGHTLKVVSEV
jgi:hypothetical protein